MIGLSYILCRVKKGHIAQYYPICFFPTHYNNRFRGIMSCPPFATGVMCMYLPRPPRAWSRVQAECSVNTSPPAATAVVPLTGEVVPAWLLAERMAQLSKGNVLQYKGNSARLTQRQRYSRIARGLWTNRNTTWATQNPVTGYTQPNTQSLQRAGNVTRIAISPASGEVLGETALPLTVCVPPAPAPVNEALPANGDAGGGINNPVIPPPVPPPPPSTDTALPVVPVPVPPAPLVVEDGGSLVCSVQANPCTGEIISSQPADRQYNLTTDSDVPGRIEALYWNDGIQTWFPRVRTVMSNSASKWPYTSSGGSTTNISAVLPLPPTLLSVEVDAAAGLATWNWTQDDRCIPGVEFDLFENNVLAHTYLSTTTSPTTVSGVHAYTATLPLVSTGGSGQPLITFFVVARGQGASSFASNEVRFEG